MDGSYNQPFGHGHRPLQSPQTPSTSATYQVNINRQKTRKWIEARKQTYDGDDWGADDFEDTSGQPAMPTQPEHSISSRLPSYAREKPASPEPASSLPNTGGPVQDSTAGDASPVTTPSGNPGSARNPTDQSDYRDKLQDRSHGNGSPVATDLLHGRDFEPVAAIADESGAIHRKNTTRKPVGSAGKSPEAVAGQSSGPESRQIYPHHEQNLATSVGSAGMLTHAKQDAEPAADVGPEQGAAVEEGPASKDSDQSQLQGLHDSSESPKLPDVARMSAFGTDLFLGNKVRTPASQPIPEASAVEEHLQARTYAPQEPSQAYALDSTSEIARMSPPIPGSSISQAPPTVSMTPSAQSSLRQADDTSGDSTEDGGLAVHALQVEKPHASPSSQHWRPSVPGDFSIASQVRSNERDVSPVSRHSSSHSAEAPSASDKQKQFKVQEPEVEPPQSPSRLITDVPSDGRTTAPEDINRPAQRIPGSSSSDYDPKRLDRAPTFSTIASSPLKESDILRDEIIKSLSPRQEASSPNLAAPLGYPLERSNEFANSGGDPTLAALGSPHQDSSHAEPSKPATVIRGASNTVAVPGEDYEITSREGEHKQVSSPQALQLPGQGERSSLDDRRRFSWEAESSSAQTPAKGTLATTIVSPDESTSVSNGESDIHLGQELSDRTQTLSGMTQRASGGEQSDSGSPAQASSHVTQYQSLEPDQEHQKSLPAERHSSTPERMKGIQSSQTEEEQEKSSRDAFSPRGLGPAGQLLTFREIMGMPSPSERISKYDDARQRFASVDSGLHDWISELKESQPDHANIGANYADAVHSVHLNPTLASTGSHTSAQQPYYQQYLNASSPSANVPSSSTRSRLAHLPQSAQAAGSVFGHSSNQIGSKGKELMQSAGKMGKGLFSKGKSKLRGTGDKQGDISPPVTPVKGRVKSDRRSSWAVNFGNRSRNADSQSLRSGIDRFAQSSLKSHSRQPSSATGQSSLAGRRVSADPTILRDSTSQSGGSELNYEQVNASVSVVNSEMPATSSLREGANHSRNASLPHTTESFGNPTWDSPSDAAERHYDSVHQDRLEARETDRNSGDWVVVPRESAIAGQDTEIETPTGNGPKYVDTAGDINTFTKASSRPEVLKRDPSFGLPQIKRTATLDLGFGDAFEPLGIPQDNQDAGLDPSTQAQQESHSADYSDSEAAIPVQSVSTQRLDGPLPPTPNSGDRTMVNQQSSWRGTTSSSGLAQANLPRLQTQSPPRQDAGIQILPAGPWKLEESHLSAPLHQVSRKRSGTSESQQFTYGLDKETGLTSPASPTSPQTAIPNRQRAVNNLPPSSAQRYPDLFTTSQIQYHQPEPLVSDKHDTADAKIPRMFPRTPSSESGGFDGAVPDSRGRRKSSGIFKEFGHRFTRAASRERRGSQTDAYSGPSEVPRPDGSSEVSGWSENVPGRNWKRPHQLPPSRGQDSLNMASAETDHQPVSGVSKLQTRHLGAPYGHGVLPSEAEAGRRPKDTAAATSSMDRFKQKGSHSNSHLSPEYKAGEQDPNKGAHVKSRLSDIGYKVVGITGALRRLNNDYSTGRKTLHVVHDSPREQPSGHLGRHATQPSTNSLIGAQGPHGSTAALPLATMVQPDQEQSHALETPSSNRRSEQSQANPSKPFLTAAVDPRTQSPRLAANKETNSGQANANANPAQALAPEMSEADLVKNVWVPSQEPASLPGSSGQLGNWNAVDHQASSVEPHDERFQSNVVRAGAGHPDQSPATSNVVHHTSRVSHGAEPLPPSSDAVHLHQDYKGMSVSMWPPQGHPAMQSASISQGYQASTLHSTPNGQLDAIAPRPQHSVISLSRGSSQDISHGAQNNPAGDQQGSRWKGFRNRISGHMNQFSAKQVKSDRIEKANGAKLLGAFKRNSRSPGETLHPEQRRQTDYSGSHDRLATSGQGWQHNSIQQYDPASQPARHQDRSDPSHFEPLGGGSGILDDHPYRPSATTIHHGMTPMQMQQRGQSSSPEARGSESAEKQYEQVPIPRAYGIVRGEGSPSTALTPPAGQVHDYHPTSDFPAQGPPSSRSAASFQQPVSAHALQPQSLNALQRPEVTSKQAANVTVENVSLNGDKVATTSRKEDRAEKTSTSLPSAAQLVKAGRPDYPREDSQVLPSVNSASVSRKPTKDQESATVEPQIDATPVAERKPLTSLSVDVAKAEQAKDEDIYDATPRVVQHNVGDVPPEQGISKSTNSKPADKDLPVTAVRDQHSDASQQAADPKLEEESVVMELEDTEEARKRTLRLDAQEEKIYYDPTDDDDMPKMSATSYPSDAWEPYYYYGD